jgi:hypothetical protein
MPNNLSFLKSFVLWGIPCFVMLYDHFNRASTALKLNGHASNKHDAASLLICWNFGFIQSISASSHILQLQLLITILKNIASFIKNNPLKCCLLVVFRKYTRL